MTSLLMRKLPRRWWLAIHRLSFPLWVMATYHGLKAGTDHRNDWYRLATLSGDQHRRLPHGRADHGQAQGDARRCSCLTPTRLNPNGPPTRTDRRSGFVVVVDEGWSTPCATHAFTSHSLPPPANPTSTSSGPLFFTSTANPASGSVASAGVVPTRDVDDHHAARALTRTFVGLVGGGRRLGRVPGTGRQLLPLTGGSVGYGTVLTDPVGTDEFGCVDVDLGGDHRRQGHAAIVGRAHRPLRVRQAHDLQSRGRARPDHGDQSGADHGTAHAAGRRRMRGRSPASASDDAPVNGTASPSRRRSSSSKGVTASPSRVLKCIGRHWHAPG